ncbi:hypothetical protein [Streptomyces coeruleofuscus]|uniref:Uncharacterized protein n=1 Tax=Streptomyces coeruleofuscus TaxID=66879 RepID=A0ABN3JDC9_9ACTN
MTERGTVAPRDHVFDNLDLETVADNRRIWLREDQGQVLHLTRVAGTPSTDPARRRIRRYAAQRPTDPLRSGPARSAR